MAIVAVCLLGVIILAFFNRRLAGVGLVVMLGWLFLPLAWQHVSHAWANNQSPYDHVRYFHESRTSDPSTMAGIGVIIPKGGPFSRCYTGWSNDPARCRWFEIPNEFSDQPITFRVYALGEQEDTNYQALRNGVCATQSTAFGLLYVEPKTCDEEFTRFSHFYVSPAGTVPTIGFRSDHWNASNHMGSMSLRHGPYWVSITSTGLTIDQWRVPYERVTEILDAYFEVLPTP